MSECCERSTKDGASARSAELLVNTPQRGDAG